MRRKWLLCSSVAPPMSRSKSLLMTAVGDTWVTTAYSPPQSPAGDRQLVQTASIKPSSVCSTALARGVGDSYSHSPEGFFLNTNELHLSHQRQTFNIYLFYFGVNGKITAIEPFPYSGATCLCFLQHTTLMCITVCGKAKISLGNYSSFVSRQQNPHFPTEAASRQMFFLLLINVWCRVCQRICIQQSPLRMSVLDSGPQCPPSPLHAHSVTQW